MVEVTFRVAVRPQQSETGVRLFIHGQGFVQASHRGASLWEFDTVLPPRKEPYTYNYWTKDAEPMSVREILVKPVGRGKIVVSDQFGLIDSNRSMEPFSCSLSGCTKLCFFDPQTQRFFDFCGSTHSKEAARQSQASRRHATSSRISGGLSSLAQRMLTSLVQLLRSPVPPVNSMERAAFYFFWSEALSNLLSCVLCFAFPAFFLQSLSQAAEVTATSIELARWYGVMILTFGLAEVGILLNYSTLRQSPMFPLYILALFIGDLAHFFVSPGLSSLGTSSFWEWSGASHFMFVYVVLCIVSRVVYFYWRFFRPKAATN